MPELKLFLFGAPRLERQGEVVEVQRRKVIALAAYLTVSAQPHSREALATLFWPDANRSRGRTNLRGELFRLSSWLGADYVQAEREQVAIATGVDLWVDVMQFQAYLAQRQAHAQAHAHPHDQLCPDCIPLLSAAVALYQNDFLAGYTINGSPEFDDWQFFQTEGLRQELATALTQLVQFHSAQGAFDVAIPFARRLAALDPLHEPAHRHLMLLYARAGQLAAARRQYKLCVATLEDELGVPPESETTALYEQIQQGAFAKESRQQDDRIISNLTGWTDAPRAISDEASTAPELPQRHQLPVQTTPFVGRTAELAKLSQLLTDPTVPLITILGPGGIGKTRLAQAAAAMHLDHFANGVYYLPLASLTDADTVVTMIGEALNFPFSGNSPPQQQLLHYLRQKSMLLLLDNFEHLLDAVDLVAEILKVAPSVKLMVTTRQRLQLHNEQLFPITGIAYPEKMPANLTSLSEWAEYAAVSLFIQSAQRVQPDFRLTIDNAIAVAQICSMVQGMPLAIVLAAAWTALLAPSEIAAEMQQGLDFLETDLRDVPERQRSMYAVFDYSWNLLTEEERSALQQLSVFRGGFTRQAAQKITGAALKTLMMLVNKSLLYRTPAGRYEVHELLRQYAAEKLAAAPADDKVAHDRHMRYYCRALQQWDDALKGSRQRAVLAEIEEEIGNVRLSWRSAIAQGRVAEINQALPALWFFFEVRGWFQEGTELFGRAATQLQNADTVELPAEGKALVLGLVLVHQGWFCYRLGLHGEAQAHGQASLKILRRLDKDNDRQIRRAIAMPLHLLGNLARIRGNHNEAKQLLEEGRRLSEETDNRWETAKICIALSVIESERGAYQASKELLQTTLATGRAFGDSWLTGFALSELGKVTETMGAYTEARQFYQEGLQLRQAMDDQFGIAWCRLGLARVAYGLDEYAIAGRLAQEAFMHFSELGNRLGAMQALTTLGNITLATGDHGAAQAHFLEVLQSAVETQATPNALDALVGLARCKSKAGRITQAVALLTLVRHHPKSVKPLIDSAVSHLTTLEADHPPEVTVQRQKQGKGLDLWQMCAELLAERYQ